MGYFDLFSEDTTSSTSSSSGNDTLEEIKNKTNEAKNTASKVNEFIDDNTINSQSIVAKSKNSIMQFPIYISKNIRVNEAHIISKQFERVYTTLVEAVFNQIQIIDEKDANNLGFLKQVHTNIKEAADALVNKYYTPIDEMDEMMVDSIHFTQQLNENCEMEFTVIPTIDSNLIAENARLMNEPLTGFSYLSEDRIEVLSGKDKDGNDVKTTKRIKDTNGADKHETILKDGDIKKINGMLPYTIQVKIKVRNGSNGFNDFEYIVGVKSVLHPINVQDLSEELAGLISGQSRTLQRVKYKTGEITFLNYLFKIDELKADALKSTKANKKWINTLKRLAEFNKTNKTLFKNPMNLVKGDVPIPNATLILSQPNIEYLINETGIDLSSVGNAKKLAKSLFLICIAIVDSSAGTMKVLFPDRDSAWDVQSLASIDAELSKTDNSALMKELNRNLNKIN